MSEHGGLDVLDHLVRPAAGRPEGALILMHGRGVDERDLYPLLDLLDPRRRLLGLAPGAPLGAPGGRHWYEVPAEPGHPPPDSFLPALDRLERFVDATGIPLARTVLGGFSQGAVMSYAAGLREGRRRPAAIVALSGFMPTAPGFELDLDARGGLPVAIGHGTADPVIPVELGRAARDLLVAGGLDVTYHESPAGHSIDPRFLGSLPAWLERALDATGGP